MKTEDFISSLDFDSKLSEHDLKGSAAHCKMLAKCGIIPNADADRIINELKKMLVDMKKGKLALSGEDIHTAMEKELIKRIGPVGGKLHTARSRNDQVVLDIKLFLKEEISSDIKKITLLVNTIKKSAQKHLGVIMPGYTHLQEAQPVLYSHYILAFAWMFVRDAERLSDCLKRADENPLGACAMAGTSFPIDRDYVSGLLGFKGTAPNSIDIVSDRDFLVEYLSAIAIYMVHISRVAEDFIVWASAPFGFVALSDKYSSGSSIMPQKRNPDYLELLRAQSALVMGKLMSLLAVLKGLPLSYNRDLQEDKRIVFEVVDIFKKSTDLLTGFLGSVKINESRMRSACDKGYLDATELADYLVNKNVPFRQGHTIVKQVVQYASKKNIGLKDIPLAKLKGFSKKFEEDIYGRLKVENIVSSKNSKGGTGRKRVVEQMKELEKRLKGIA